MSDYKSSLPMWITYTRIILAPFLFMILHEGLPHRFLFGMCLFIVAASTDWLDGHYARIYNCESNLGKFMDTIADKILMLSALLCLHELGSVDIFMIFIIISRDILIGGLRSVAAANHIVIAAKSMGKAKTAIQMIAVPLMLFGKHIGSSWLEMLSYIILWGTVFLSLLSALDYALDYRRTQGTPA